MENSMNQLANIQGTTDVSNHQQTGVDTVERLVDELQSYKQELLSRENRIKQLTIENNTLKDEIIALRAAQNDNYQSRIHDSVLQLNNSNEKDLDEDCWLKIFSYLSLEDMMQVERVCEKWYQVSRHWFKQVQTLQYHAFGDEITTIRLRRKYYERKIYEKTGNFSCDDLILILHSYCHYIKYYRVDFYGREGDRNKESEKFIYQWVPQLCKNIVDVKIHGDNSINTLITFEVMATHWKKLEKLDIEYRLLLPIEDNFLKLLRNNEQLKTFTFAAKFSTGGLDSDNFFTYLPTTIKKIDVTDMSANKTVEQLSNFISASKNFTTLQTLEFSSFCLSHAVVAAIANIQSLTHLSLNSIACESPRSIELIANLKGLKSLELNYNKNLHEDSFINIVESCIQLEWLSICCPSCDEIHLTDKGMDAIAKLKRLKCLTITAEHVTIGSIINLCDRLEVLVCYDWKFNDSDTIKLLKKATNLRLIDVSENVNLTKDILQAANEIANKRKNNILCIAAYIDSLSETSKVIDTPYFKYFTDIVYVPLEIFPNDIRNYMRKLDK